MKTFRRWCIVVIDLLMILWWVKVLFCDYDAGWFLSFFMLFIIVYNIYAAFVYCSFSVISSYMDKKNLFLEGLFLLVLFSPFAAIYYYMY